MPPALRFDHDGIVGPASASAVADAGSWKHPASFAFAFVLALSMPRIPLNPGQGRSVQARAVPRNPAR